MTYKKTIDYENLNINKINFTDFKGDDEPSKEFRSLYCTYNDMNFNMISPLIKFTSNFNRFIDPDINKSQFYIPINGYDDLDLFKFNSKLIEFQKLLETDEFKIKYNIPIDYKLVNIFKKSSNPKYADQLKTKLNVTSTNVYQTYSYKNNPNKVFKKKININIPTDVYVLVNNNSYVKSKIQPFKLWISKSMKLYGLTFKVLEIEISSKKLCESKNSYSYQFLLLDEEDINIE